MRNRYGGLVKTRFMCREFDRKCRVRLVVGSNVKRKSLFLLLSGLGIFLVSLTLSFLPLYPYDPKSWSKRTSNVPSGIAFIFTRIFDLFKATDISSLVFPIIETVPPNKWLSISLYLSSGCKLGSVFSTSCSVEYSQRNSIIFLAVAYR